MTFEKFLQEWKPEAVAEYRPKVPLDEIADDVSRKARAMKRRHVIDEAGYLILGVALLVLWAVFWNSRLPRVALAGLVFLAAGTVIQFAAHATLRLCFRNRRMDLPHGAYLAEERQWLEARIRLLRSQT